MGRRASCATDGRLCDGPVTEIPRGCSSPLSCGRDCARRRSRQREAPFMARNDPATPPSTPALPNTPGSAPGTRPSPARKTTSGDLDTRNGLTAGHEGAGVRGCGHGRLSSPLAGLPSGVPGWPGGVKTEGSDLRRRARTTASVASEGASRYNSAGRSDGPVCRGRPPRASALSGVRRYSGHERPPHATVRGHRASHFSGAARRRRCRTASERQPRPLPPPSRTRSRSRQLHRPLRWTGQQRCGQSSRSRG